MRVGLRLRLGMGAHRAGQMREMRCKDRPGAQHHARAAERATKTLCVRQLAQLLQRIAADYHPPLSRNGREHGPNDCHPLDLPDECTVSLFTMSASISCANRIRLTNGLNCVPDSLL